MDYIENKNEVLKKIEERCILRGFSKQTSKSYIYNVLRFLNFLEKSRLNLNNDSVKRYLLIQNVGVNTSRLQYASISFFLERF